MDARDTKDRLEELRSKNRKRKLFRRKIFSGAFLLLMLVVVLGIASIFLKIINYVNDKSNEDYQNYTERRIDRLGAMNAFDNDYTNILVVGFDSTREKKVEMIFILTFENNSEKTQLLSIPNNILIHSLETPQYISDVYDIYGSDFLNHEISNLLDLTIHQYICFDISDLSDFIDVLDGIDIYVEEDMKYDDPSKSIEKGYQTLSGEETKNS